MGAEYLGECCDSGRERQGVLLLLVQTLWRNVQLLTNYKDPYYCITWLNILVHLFV